MRNGKTYRLILVPLDGSKLAENVLPHVMAIVAAFKADVVLMHVVPVSGKMPHPITPSQQQAMEDISSYLKEVARALQTEDVPEIGWRVTCGEPAEDLARYVQEAGVDLIAMSTHGQGDAPGAQMGSVATQLLQRVSVPILLLRPEGPAREL